MTKKPYLLYLYLSFVPLFFAAACSKNENYLKTTSIPVHQEEDYLNLSEVLETEASSSCYAWCYIHADEEKRVAFTMGIDNDAKVWVNDSLYFAGHSGNITKNEIIFNVTLKKGNNRIVVRISSAIDAFGFYLNILSPGTVNKNWLGKNFYSLSEHYLVPVKKAFEINIQNPCYNSTQPA